MGFESKPPNSEGPKVVNIKNGEAYIGSGSAPESLEADLDVESVHATFKALTKVVTKDGVDLQRNMGFMEKKFEKLTSEEQAPLLNQFMFAVKSDPQRYLDLFFRKTYFEGIDEALKKFLTKKQTREYTNMEIKVWDNELKRVSFLLNDDDIIILQDFLFQNKDAFITHK